MSGSICPRVLTDPSGVLLFPHPDDPEARAEQPNPWGTPVVATGVVRPKVLHGHEPLGGPQRAVPEVPLIGEVDPEPTEGEVLD